MGSNLLLPPPLLFLIGGWYRRLQNHFLTNYRASLIINSMIEKEKFQHKTPYFKKTLKNGNLI